MTATPMECNSKSLEAMTKQALRRHIRQLKQTYTSEQLATQSVEIIERLEAHPLFRAASTVLLYHSLPDEVDTHGLINKYAAVKTVLLPTVVGDHLQLHQYHPTTGTHIGSFGIVESEGALVNDYTSIDLAIVPGMAFDKQGHRLGRGRGYYDRLLPELRCPILGLCFDFQLIDRLPTEPHDRAVNAVITNRQALY